MVFPELDEGEIPMASVASVSNWDSLASINLYSLVEEEFGVEINIEDLVDLISFELILRYLEGENASA